MGKQYALLRLDEEEWRELLAMVGDPITPSRARLRKKIERVLLVENVDALVIGGEQYGVLKDAAIEMRAMAGLEEPRLDLAVNLLVRTLRVFGGEVMGYDNPVRMLLVAFDKIRRGEGERGSPVEEIVDMLVELTGRLAVGRLKLMEMARRWEEEVLRDRLEREDEEGEEGGHGKGRTWRSMRWDEIKR